MYRPDIRHVPCIVKILTLHICDKNQTLMSELAHKLYVYYVMVHCQCFMSSAVMVWLSVNNVMSDVY